MTTRFRSNRRNDQFWTLERKSWLSIASFATGFEQLAEDLERLLLFSRILLLNMLYRDGILT